MFVDLGRACDGVGGGGGVCVWCCVGGSGLAERCVRVVRDVRWRCGGGGVCCGSDGWVRVGVGLRQGSALVFFFAMVVDGTGWCRVGGSVGRDVCG